MENKYSRRQLSNGLDSAEKVDQQRQLFKFGFIAGEDSWLERSDRWFEKHEWTSVILTSTGLVAIVLGFTYCCLK